MSEDDKTMNTLKKIGIYSDQPPLRPTKKIQDDEIKYLIDNAQEYPWMVKTEKVPSGESLLKLFGKVLFETTEIVIKLRLLKQVIMKLDRI